MVWSRFEAGLAESALIILLTPVVRGEAVLNLLRDAGVVPSVKGVVCLAFLARKGAYFAFETITKRTRLNTCIVGRVEDSVNIGTLDAESIRIAEGAS